MNIFIRHQDSGLYFKQVDHWVSRIEEARVFSSPEEAQEFCRQFLLVHVEVLTYSESLLKEKKRDSLGLMRFSSSTRPAARS
jgi:hypothetical protein